MINFLESAEYPFDDDDMLNCFGNDAASARSPWIPVVVELVRVPMFLDTEAEVTILSSSFLQRLFPGRQLPSQGGRVRSLGGKHIAIKRPVTLTILICGITLDYPLYHCENVQTILLGYDVVLLLLWL